MTDKKIKCPECGNNKFLAKCLGGGMWRIQCVECGCYTERFAPVVTSEDALKWLNMESE